MKFWVGVTDNTWFNFLSARGLDEAIFFGNQVRHHRF